MKSIVRIAALLLFISCNKDEPVSFPKGSLEFVGAVQKGPYIKGSSIVVQELGEDLAPFGNVYHTSILDDFGTFEIGTTVSSPYLEVIARGFYFNEVSGELSSAELTLRSLVEADEQTVSNVNLLTTLTIDRIIFLIENGQSFEEASQQAGTELLDIFEIKLENVDFNNFDMSKSNENGAVLTAISSIFQSNNTVAELSELIAEFIEDFKEDGVIDSQLIEVLKSSASQLNLQSIRWNLEERYATLGLEVEIPLFEKFAKRLVSLEVINTYPKPEEIGVSLNLNTIDIQFNKSLKMESVNTQNISILDSSMHTVSGELLYDNETFNVTFIPNEELLPNAQYVVLLENSIEGIDGDQLGDQFQLKFTTEGFATIHTILASDITKFSFTSGIEVLNDWGINVLKYGICWDINQNPTIELETKTEIDPIEPTIKSTAHALTPNTTYFFRAYAINHVGVSYGAEYMVETTETDIGLELGQQYAGGLIFYFDETGEHGIVSTTEIQNSVEWGCRDQFINGTSSDVGSGQANTTAILDQCSSIVSAAKICDDLVFNRYDDWYLPSKGELDLIYTNLYLNGIGNFNDLYRSSTENDGNSVWSQQFSDGQHYTLWKGSSIGIRAVRSF